MGAFALLIVAIGAAGWASRNTFSASSAEDVAPGTAPKVDPFADVPEENSPTGGGGSGSSRIMETNLAPEGLLAEPTWRGAIDLVEQAFALSKEAETAKKSDDDALYRSKAIKAREVIQRALDATAEFEMNAQEKYGETDRLVRKVIRERQRWFDLRTKYRSLK